MLIFTKAYDGKQVALDASDIVRVDEGEATANYEGQTKLTFKDNTHLWIKEPFEVVMASIRIARACLQVQA
jgi:hypothetical protein